VLLCSASAAAAAALSPPAAAEQTNPSPHASLAAMITQSLARRNKDSAELQHALFLQHDFFFFTYHKFWW
jgi:hypothetical protein